ncbi:Protein of unknown function [Bacillus mycoides]|nr:Protein of unknown function [Bacillus mycoides]SCC42148.1 Protein of unknown function [Bacillus mycoides]SCM88054.1 Protein of unknown function [Bacillus mycoides]SCM95948.1 Protein of unknown function [Bacillus mycoides]
MGQMKK